MSDRAERILQWDRLERPILTPSLLACDFGAMRDVFASFEGSGCAAVHLDVMDGHFVPNFTYGPPVVARWREHTRLPFDTHLMMSDPDRYAEEFAAAGCDTLIFHIEAVPEPSALLDRIKGLGCRAGLALNPATPVDAVFPYLERLDTLLVMSVVPGFGGQAFQPEVLEKVRLVRRARADLRISVDGGIDAATAGSAVAAGADQLVAGSAIFRSGGNVAAALSELDASARRGLP